MERQILHHNVVAQTMQTTTRAFQSDVVWRGWCPSTFYYGLEPVLPRWPSLASSIQRMQTLQYDTIIVWYDTTVKVKMKVKMKEKIKVKVKVKVKMKMIMKVKVKVKVKMKRKVKMKVEMSKKE
jgi:hypothetical protein